VPTNTTSHKNRQPTTIRNILTCQLAVATIVADVIVSLSVCPSVTLVHPAKAVGQNKTLFY